MINSIWKCNKSDEQQRTKNKQKTTQYMTSPQQMGVNRPWTRLQNQVTDQWNFEILQSQEKMPGYHQPISTQC